MSENCQIGFSTNCQKTYQQISSGKKWNPRFLKNCACGQQWPPSPPYRYKGRMPRRPLFDYSLLGCTTARLVPSVINSCIFLIMSVAFPYWGFRPSPPAPMVLCADRPILGMPSSFLNGVAQSKWKPTSSVRKLQKCFSLFITEIRKTSPVQFWNSCYS